MAMVALPPYGGPTMGPFMGSGKLEPPSTCAGYPAPGPPPAGAPMMPPQRLPFQGVPQGSPMIPNMEFPPQPIMDSAPEDGPLSVAFGFQRTVGHIGPLRPCPDTKQYVHRGASRRMELAANRPRESGDICGYVMAAANPDDMEGESEDGMKVKNNEFNMVFQCISGWILMFWRSKEEFDEGIHGGRRAPRALGWFDLRKAYDLRLEMGNPNDFLAANRFTVMTSQGNCYFCVELPEDVPVWYNAIRRVIQDASLQRTRSRDTAPHQRKRWPAAIGIARALVHGMPIGDRAMAILFHAYDIDYNCHLDIGELMVLIQEMVAAMIHDEGLAEGRERDTAVYSARFRVPDDELYDRAVRMRRQCDPRRTGKVDKDAFMYFGQAALMEAISSNVFGDLITGAGEAYDGFDHSLPL